MAVGFEGFLLIREKAAKTCIFKKVHHVNDSHGACSGSFDVSVVALSSLSWRLPHRRHFLRSPPQNDTHGI